MVLLSKIWFAEESKQIQVYLILCLMLTDHFLQLAIFFYIKVSYYNFCTHFKVLSLDAL